MAEHICPYGEGKCPILKNEVVMRENCKDRCKTNDGDHELIREDFCTMDKQNERNHNIIFADIKAADVRQSKDVKDLDIKVDGKIGAIVKLNVAQLLTLIGSMGTIIFFLLKGRG